MNQLGAARYGPSWSVAAFVAAAAAKTPSDEGANNALAKVQAVNTQFVKR